MARLRPMARVRATIGVVQKRPIFTPGGGECGFLRGDGEIAGGDQLAAGGGGDALDFGDHGLRNRLDFLHQVGADVEDAAIVVDDRGRSSGRDRGR